MLKLSSSLLIISDIRENLKNRKQKQNRNKKTNKTKTGKEIRQAGRKKEVPEKGRAVSEPLSRNL
jgi:hypothetical protein